MSAKRCQSGFLAAADGKPMMMAVFLVVCCLSAWAPGTARAADAAANADAPALSRHAAEEGVVEEYRDGYTRLVLEDVVGRGGYTSSLLADPPRLVVDVRDPRRELSRDRLPLKGEAFAQLRVGRYPEKMRLVFDFRQAQESAPVVRAERGALVVEVSGGNERMQAPAGVGGPEAPAAPARGARVSAIDFQFEAEHSDVLIRMEQADAAYEILEQGNTLVVRLPGGVIPDRLLRPIDTRGFASAILAIEPSQDPAGGRAAVTLRLREKSGFTDAREGKEIRVRVKNPERVAAGAPLPPPDLAAADTARVAVGGQEVRAAGTIAQPAPEPRPRPAAQVRGDPPPAAVEAPYRTPEKGYSGRKISLDFKDADIQNVLRLIAEVSGKNIVISDAVKGKVTVRLMNVPWDMALDVILKTYALDKETLGPNILRVAPHTQLKKERDEALNAAKALIQVEDLLTEVVTLNYAQAQEFQGLLAKMKSARSDATILVDNRTNSLVIKDIPSAIQEMIALIRNLDRQTPQVLIEARIVELDVAFSRELGIQWGTAYNAGPATGNPTGMNFPGTASVGGAAQNVSGLSPAGVANPVVNLPAAVDQTAGGALGFSLASITNSFRLDMQLSALEKKKHARILSSPRVATLNNQEAWIQQGEDVPYQTTSDEGTKTEFKAATLRLSVTPQINADRSIVMKINVNKDTALREVTAGVVIGKKEAVTVVLVNDGETAVIGGIYTDDEQRSTGGVPWFMDVPGLGYLFKKEGKEKKRTELMIFITPRIIPARHVPVEQWIH